MNFSLSGILAVMSHAVAPFVPLMLAVAVVLVLAQLAGRLRGYRLGRYHSRPVALIALLGGLSTLWWLPLVTHSQLDHVSTAPGWAALMAAALGVALLVWLTLHPLSYLLGGRGRG